MPRLSQYFVKSSFICLAAAFTISGLILAAKGGLGSPVVWEWLPAHIALALNGWLIQLAMGVAYWIFPRILGADRGRPFWAWTAFFVFQGGILLVVISLGRFGGRLLPNCWHRA
jgi:heme/copper-type cytochrome/quinol oxidase subunit 1